MKIVLSGFLGLIMFGLMAYGVVCLIEKFRGGKKNDK